MMSRKLRKMLAGTLAGVMVLGTGTAALAADTTGSGTGEGSFEGHVDKDVLSVELPTSTETTFAYTMDPEGLIAATEGAKDKDATFEDGATVYFLSDTNTYTKDSAKLKVTNKGTVDADVTIDAETDANAKITMASSDQFTGDAAELYLGLKVANETPVAVKANSTDQDYVKSSVVVGLKGRAANFEIQYNEATKKYEYAEKEGVLDTAWNSFEFGLTGACNKDGDWSDADLAGSDVTVTWSYAERDAENSSATLLPENAVDKPADAAPSIATTSYALVQDQAIEIPVDLGSGDLKATGLSAANFGSTNFLGNTVTFDATTNKITVNTVAVNAMLGMSGNQTITMVFDDGVTSIPITFTH